MRNAVTKIDFYKADHRRQYPDNTSLIYSNFTPRKSRIPGIDGVVFFAMQFIILDYLIREWNQSFFNRPKEQVLARYKRRMDNALGKDAIDIAHIAALHDLGYLPIMVKAVPEGTIVPIKVACFTVRNTIDEFFWLVNYLESVISNKVWKGCTSATIALQYRRVFEQYHAATVGGDDSSFVMWQGHDFSYRGMSGDEDACTSGGGHLLSFYGTDTVPAIDFLEDYYFADSDEEMIGGSVPATEHSVMCMGGMEDEIGTFKRLITEIYPKGVISIVSDTWGYWTVLIEYLPILKDKILARWGKVVIRPDSGDPYRIIVGYFPDELERLHGELEDEDAEPYYVIKGTTTHVTQDEINGSIQTLWNIFGGSTTEKGFKQLDPHIGLIYGDSITMDRQIQILEGLKRKGFASTNVVLGIGSFTYEYQTRDTFGFAMKATYGEIKETLLIETYPSTEQIVKTGREIYKDPKTDDGTKKSAKGLLMVFKDKDGVIRMKDQCTWEEENRGMLQTVFLDGVLMRQQSLAGIRKLINKQL